MRISIFCLVFTIVLLPCCDTGKTSARQESLEKRVIRNYADIVLANYEESLDLAEKLQKAVEKFLATPSPETMQAARNAWLQARNPYGQTEAYRFYSGPIDDEEGLEGYLNSWPLDESYIDYVQGNDKAGVINDLSHQFINKQNLLALNEEGGDANISTGYHAVEFLLWGQDLSQDGAGNRPYTDYITDGSGTHDNQQRRGQYLLVVTELLVEHLQKLVDAWARGRTDNYRSKFLAVPEKEALHRIITGIEMLCSHELPGERMSVALMHHDQEEEHSCFSDNTHNDILYNIAAISNVYYGRYTRNDGSQIDGPGLDDLVKAADLAIDAQMAKNIEMTQSAAELLKQAPFDKLISADNKEGNDIVKAVIDKLRQQSETISSVKKSLLPDLEPMSEQEKSHE